MVVWSLVLCLWWLKLGNKRRLNSRSDEDSIVLENKYYFRLIIVEENEFVSIILDLVVLENKFVSIILDLVVFVVADKSQSIILDLIVLEDKFADFISTYIFTIHILLTNNSSFTCTFTVMYVHTLIFTNIFREY